MKNILFKFTFYEEQINAIWYLFYKQKDLLLLAKTKCSKNSIFQLLSFITLVTNMILILIPLKLF